MIKICKKCGKTFNGWTYDICNYCFTSIVKRSERTQYRCNYCPIQNQYDKNCTYKLCTIALKQQPLKKGYTMASCDRCGQELLPSEKGLCVHCEKYLDKVVNTEKAMRDNGNKLQYGLIAPEIFTALAGPYTMGAKKYEPRNCEKPMSFTDLDSALERHMNSFRRGEETANDSGLSHLHHAIWNIGMMIMHLERGTLIDDRPKGCTPNDQYWKQPEDFYEYSGKSKPSEG